MTIEEHIKYWLDSAEHDKDTMNTLFEAGKYDWALFIGHLVLEKVLKALYIKNNRNQVPPKIHNLVKLAEISHLEPDSERALILDRINDFNIEVRYPQYRNEFYKTCTKEYAEDNIKQIKELNKWIRSQLT